jgi:hypothetical protein
MHKELLIRRSVYFPGLAFNFISNRVVFCVLIARGVVLNLGIVIMTVKS